jgi:hypothetical protein
VPIQKPVFQCVMAKTPGWWRRATSRHRKLPDFLIIGAQRSGTSTLYQYISRHPDVRAAFRKEVHYFDTYYDRGLGWYRACFPFRGFTGESSPSYLAHPEVPSRIASALPDVKLIAIVRNPVDRAYSAYQRNVRHQRESRPFAEAVFSQPGSLKFAYRERGLYAEAIERWLQHFKREQLLVVGAERFFADPPAVLERVFRFLGLSAWRGDASVKDWIEEKYSYDRYGDMDDALHRELAAYFRPHNERLYQLAGENFGWET